MNTDKTYLKKEVEKRRLQGAILRDLCGVPAAAIREAEERGGESKRGYPCPKCGGNDRFNVTSLADGRILCRRCKGDHGNGVKDYFGAVMWSNDCDFNEACRLIAEYLNRH